MRSADTPRKPDQTTSMSSGDEVMWEKMRRAVGEEGTLEAFRGLVERAAEADLDQLVEAVDQSDYGLDDWIEALVEFDRWLRERGVEARPFPTMLGYVHCCTLMNSPKVRLPILKVIVNQSLTDFGFDATSDAQT